MTIATGYGITRGELPYHEGTWEECDAINAILATIIARAIANDPKRKPKPPRPS